MLLWMLMVVGELTGSHYFGANGWFIFTIIINAIISFWIGNRFYKLSKKDNHLSFEIRALRKDIEDFLGTQFNNQINN